jgi:hypothetical protein
MIALNLVTPKAAAKHKHLFNKPASGQLQTAISYNMIILHTYTIPIENYLLWLYDINKLELNPLENSENISKFHKNVTGTIARIRSRSVAWVGLIILVVHVRVGHHAEHHRVQHATRVHIVVVVVAEITLFVH